VKNLRKPPLSPESIKDAAIQWVRVHSLEDATDITITCDTDLLDIGLLDSIAFVDLIAFLQTKSGKTIDLFELSAEEFSTISGLCRDL